MRARRQYGEANLTQAGVVLILRSTSKQERRDALAAARTRHKGLPKIGLPSAQVWKPTPSCRSFNQAGSKKIITARAQEHRESMLFPINIAQPEVLKAEVIIEDLDMDLDEDLDVYLHVEFEATEDLEMVGVEPEIEVEEADLDAIRRRARAEDAEIEALREQLDSPYSWDGGSRFDLIRRIEAHMEESRAWWQLCPEEWASEPS